MKDSNRPPPGLGFGTSPSHSPALYHLSYPRPSLPPPSRTACTEDTPSVSQPGSANLHSRTDCISAQVYYYRATLRHVKLYYYYYFPGFHFSDFGIREGSPRQGWGRTATTRACPNKPRPNMATASPRRPAEGAAGRETRCGAPGTDGCRQPKHRTSPISPYGLHLVQSGAITGL